MNKTELKRLKERIERLQQADKGVVIQFTDGLFKFRNHTLTKIDNADNIDEIFSCDSKHMLIVLNGNEMDYIRILNVTDAIKDGGLDGWF